MALGALIIKARVGQTDEELVEQIMVGASFFLLACWLQLFLVHRAACNSHVVVVNEYHASA